ncbi:LPXTG cell wall anchor domain-containing protein [Streptomyces sp. WAC 00631]|uniref:LPXTG cell wall anchor domain-containing protein n=1 Tax=unclassified Streptomyces TaxID=2593676 RepID=UPI000F7A0CE3|nr:MULTISPECIES: LPXTG cell wall anchor domain-containing protein [unclassified Streptomyces]MCC5037200.1 LPXTG cell wall anchor domain-containing protein [Streptomyces sp. WAC 00631]MCC9737801.1 LPXTG cell wall anchor domain-containing protein [Streptomyces sp. MNU89]
MRSLTSACAVAAAAAASLLLAPVAYATPPGDNGTVKIHDAETGEEFVKNEPHVCVFYLDAFKFDGGQQIEWKILQMPPTGTLGTEAESGTLTLDAEGHGRSDDLKLPDGHYKLVWNFEGENGKAKQKVFRTDCEDEDENEGGNGGSSGGPSGEPSEEPSGKPSTEPGGETTGETTGEPSNEPTAADTAGQNPSGGGKEDLAETGASAVIGTSAAALVLLGAGGVLLMRRRAARGES